MKSDRKILAINTDEETHINFYLSIILANDHMKSWFYERYINLVMYENIIDFVDNINYSGIIGHVRSYSWEETEQRNLQLIIKEVIEGGGFLNIWVDEFDLPCSIRYLKQHFVHPIIIYGYDNDNEIFNAWFFDIYKGYRTVEIMQMDFIKSVKDVKEYYMNGGTSESINQTVGIFSVYGSFPLLPFDLQVFLSQLKDYLYGKNNRILQWYTLSRPELVASKSVVYGINVYLRLLEMLQINMEDTYFTYKSLHDFAMHKSQLLLRFKYIEEHYDLGDEYRQYVLQIKKVSDLLERIRLLNIKFQMEEHRFPAKFSYNKKFLAKLRTTLLEAYNIEMTVLPEIYRLLTAVSYPQNYLKEHDTMLLDIIDGTITEQYAEFDLGEYGKYLYRIDIVRNGTYEYIERPEQLLLNDERVYYIESDNPDRSPVRTIDFGAYKVNNIKLYTDTRRAKYTIILFLFPGQTKNDERTFQFNGNDNAWHSFNQIENISYKDNFMQFDITGIDPFMVYDNVGVNADRIKYIRIRMETNDKSDLAQIFFTTVDSPHISREKSVYFRISPDDKMKTYTIDMSEHPKWNGLIQSIRFDPVAYLASQPRETERTMCRFEFVRFTEEAPLYDSRSDYGKAQGICGWHYETVNDAEDTVLFGWDQENKIWRRGTQECGITIDKQYSNGKTEAIRKWTAPVAGKYTVAYSGSPLALSENIITIGGDRFVKTLHEPFNGELTLELDKGDEICLKTLYGSCNNIHIVIQKNDS